MKRIIISLFALILTLAVTATAGKKEHVVEKVDAEDAKRVDFTCELGAGIFTIKPENMTDAARCEITYNPRRVEYYVESRVKRNTCYIELESEHLKKSNIDSDDNEWEIFLSTNYESVIDIEIGACEADIDLGGIPLENMSLEVGAASGYIEFSEPNPIVCEEISIEAGASSVEITNIGNANFEYFSFDGGVGSFELDFRGEYNHESTIDIEIGLGSAEITLPKGIPVRVETGSVGWFSSVDIHNRDLDEYDEGEYESDDFEGADIRITLIVDVGMGSVDIYWK